MRLGLDIHELRVRYTCDWIWIYGLRDVELGVGGNVNG
jgi:hypothetical protein